MKNLLSSLTYEVKALYYKVCLKLNIEVQLPGWYVFRYYKPPRFKKDEKVYFSYRNLDGEMAAFKGVFSFEGPYNGEKLYGEAYAKIYIRIESMSLVASSQDCVVSKFDEGLEKARAINHMLSMLKVHLESSIKNGVTPFGMEYPELKKITKVFSGIDKAKSKKGIPIVNTFVTKLVSQEKDRERYRITRVFAGELIDGIQNKFDFEKKLYPELIIQHKGNNQYEIQEAMI